METDTAVVINTLVLCHAYLNSFWYSLLNHEKSQENVRDIFVPSQPSLT